MHRLAAMIGASALFVSASTASATTYNLTSDFSTTTNPSGVWSYRGDSTVLPSFTGNQANTGAAPTQSWAPGNVGGNFLPSIFLATDNNNQWLIGDVVVHTPDGSNGPSFTNANVLFTAPAAGTADISGNVWLARDLDRTQSWELRINGVVQASDSLAIDGTDGRSSPDMINLLDVVLAAGSTIELAMFRTGEAGDYLGLDLTVDLTASAPSAVPLPAALPLFATGLAGLGLLGWRRRRKEAGA